MKNCIYDNIIYSYNDNDLGVSTTVFGVFVSTTLMTTSLRVTSTSTQTTALTVITSNITIANNKNSKNNNKGQLQIQ